MRRGTRYGITAGVLALALGLPGCVARFSPETIRHEIVLQTGQDPLTAFELSLGRFTTLLLRNALAVQGGGELPFGGLDELQLAVFEPRVETGPAIDVTRIDVRGWEPVLRLHDERRSGMVLVRPAGTEIGDLVVVGAGPRRVIYGRLRGRLNPELPAALGDVLREQGPDEVQRVLSDLAGTE